MIKMFLDDERFPVTNDFVIVRSMNEAIDYINSNGMPDFISFDHDLGDGGTGYDLVKWIIDIDIQNDIIKSDFDFYVHSQNPIGKKNIESMLNNYLRFKFNDRQEKSTNHEKSV